MNLYETRNKIESGISMYDLNLRVVYYARVSTDKDIQLNSLENQKSYFEEYILNNKNWDFIDSYIDEGISGTSINNRTSFLQMIEDAKNNKFDLILTKEISRFSRNTIDSLNYTTRLLSYGVAVHFLSDNINTINTDSELRLAIMSSIAQEEVRKLSERVKFGLKRSIKSGNILGGNNHTGYIKEKGRLKIDKEKKEIIEILFSMYATGKYSFDRIADFLFEKGYVNTIGKRYAGNVLSRMLTNPKYKGYYCGNKSYIEDYKTHKKKHLDKKEWLIYKDLNVPEIVSEELWNLANSIYKERKEEYKRSKTNTIRYDYAYTGIIKCKEHNSIYIRCGSGQRRNNPVWCCNEYVRFGRKGCLGLKLNERKLDNIFISILDNYLDKTNIIDEMINKYKMLIDDKITEKELELHNKKIEKLNKEKRQLLSLLTDNIIDKDEFKNRNNELKEEINIVINEYKILKNKFNNENSVNEKILSIKNNLEKKLEINQNIKIYISIFINQVVVDSPNKKLEITFKNGEFKKIDYQK